jgi:hypothetical protein
VGGVKARGETFVIDRGRKPGREMSQVRPLRVAGADLLPLFHSLPKADPGFWDTVKDGAKQVPAARESPWGY